MSLEIIEDPFHKKNIEKENQEPAEIRDMINSCSNMSIFESAKCVNDKVKIFYSYNESNVGEDLSFEELKEYGGVCSHYANLYCEIGEELGFNIERPVIKTEDYHAFCIWSDETGYVILDQRKISYTELGN